MPRAPALARVLRWGLGVHDVQTRVSIESSAAAAEASPASAAPRRVRAGRAGACPASAHPAPGGAVRPGAGALRVASVRGESAILSCASSAPLRLLAPRPRGRACWVVAASLGGGLVGGDALALEIEVGEGATACLGTQAETKVYRSSGSAAVQALHARVADGAALFLLPDPVSCFAGARYRQEQRFELSGRASLLVLDAVVAGRSARGERWAFESYAARNTVEVGGGLVLADALRLCAADGAPPAERMGDLELLATVILLGPALRAEASALLEEVRAAPAAPGAEVLLAASPLADGALLRVASRSVEAGLASLHAHLAFVAGHLDGDPLTRRP